MVTTSPRNPFKKSGRPHVHESESSVTDLPEFVLEFLDMCRSDLLERLNGMTEALREYVPDLQLRLNAIIALRISLLNSMCNAAKVSGQYIHLVYINDGYDAIVSNIPNKSLTKDEAIAQVRDLVQ